MPNEEVRPGALSPEQMNASFATAGEGYAPSFDAPLLRYPDLAEKIWGGKLIPVMAAPEATGRFAGAKLSCPATACTGMLHLPVKAKSLVYRNADAAEMFMCLEGELEIRYGSSLQHAIRLGRFDMIGIPAGVRHRVENGGDSLIKAVVVLSVPPEGAYQAEVLGLDASLPQDALSALQVSAASSLSVSPDEDALLDGRVSRFTSMVPYKKSLSTTSGIPPEATEMLSAKAVYPLLVPEGHIGRSRTATMYGNPGLYLSIAQCSEGDDGPPPHSHSDTQETFFVLEGDWEFSTGFDREQKVAAGPYDILAMRPKVMRAFANRSGQPAHLFVIIQGPNKMNDTVSFAKSIGEEVERRFGKETIDAYAKIKMNFNADEEFVSA